MLFGWLCCLNTSAPQSAAARGEKQQCSEVWGSTARLRVVDLASTGPRNNQALRHSHRRVGLCSNSSRGDQQPEVPLALLSQSRAAGQAGVFSRHRLHSAHQVLNRQQRKWVCFVAQGAEVINLWVPFDTTALAA